ncbi:hypothetical protein PRUPE_1G184600 [Prunus persica]|uniref:Uncharacterized protein n=1 Tax=Prunus persica TaxID=3760 RepID=A0A251R299_PRUPE|nr:hypothetical protein PRUPE_1G184600 [Prunus persica]
MIYLHFQISIINLTKNHLMTTICGLSTFLHWGFYSSNAGSKVTCQQWL